MATDKKVTWLRASDKSFEDSIAGNREGLEALRSAIEYVLDGKNNSSEIVDFTGADLDTDFRFIVLTEDEDIVPEKIPRKERFAQFLIITVLITWLVVLPLLGLVTIFGIFF
jgi:hypothetical protein